MRAAYHVTGSRSDSSTAKLRPPLQTYISVGRPRAPLWAVKVSSVAVALWQPDHEKIGVSRNIWSSSGRSKYSLFQQFVRDPKSQWTKFVYFETSVLLKLNAYNLCLELCGGSSKLNSWCVLILRRKPAITSINSGTANFEMGSSVT